MELAILDAAGVVGARWAPRAEPLPNACTMARVEELGWSNQFFVRGEEEIARWRTAILGTKGKFVLDHMGNPPPGKGLDSPEFRFTRECLDTGRCWAKLSPRPSAHDDFPFADTLPFIHDLVARYPTRLVWGSDWPHPHYDEPMVDDGKLIDLAAAWIPDEAIRKKVFVDNPAEAFGW
jgi:predicted TIM-barrel fold metal-dependent hydrolase